jgi:predicted PurR-regulated permease PerM
MIEKNGEDSHARDLQLGPSVRLRAFVLLALTIAGLFICFLLLWPFLPALVWSLALAILFLPAHRWIEANLHNVNLAAGASVLLIGALVIVPVLLVSGRIIEAAGGGALAVKDKIGSGEWRQVIENNDLLAPLARWTAHIDFHKALESVTAWLASTSAAFVSESVLSVVTLIVTLYLLFYFLRDREVALNWLREMSPLSGSEMDLLFDRVADTVRATLYGTVVVAIVQGTLGGLMFWWLGLPMPVFWGVVMGLLAIVPMLGAFVVWVPAAVYLALSGDWGSTLILTVWGTIVVGGIDNLLYPILVKDQLSLHTVPAFISIVGGLVLFGASGLLLGPIILALTIFFLELWRD